jgi:hypothetical protein
MHPLAQSGRCRALIRLLAAGVTPAASDVSALRHVGAAAAPVAASRAHSGCASSTPAWDLWGNRADEVLQQHVQPVHVPSPADLAAAHRQHVVRKASRLPMRPVALPAAHNFAEPPQAGRVVLNHSTHLPGLIDALRRLVSVAPSPGIKSAVPGRIATAAAVSEALSMRVTVPLGVGRVTHRRQPSRVAGAADEGAVPARMGPREGGLGASGGEESGNSGGGGWRIVARRGRGVQEVFVVTRLDAEALRTAIARVLGGTAQG